MNNVSILGKFLIIMGAFGLFAIATAVYSGSRMWQIDVDYSALGSHETEAALNLARSNRYLLAVRAAVGDLVISSTDAGNQRAMAELTEARKAFEEFMDKSAKMSPADATDINALKARGVSLIDQSCKNTISLGASATNGPGVAESQSAYVNDCSPPFAVPWP